MLSLEQEDMGFLRSADGGGITTDVQTYQYGFRQDIWRQVGRTKYGEITLQVGMGLSPDFYQWISGFFDRTIIRKNGAIVAADFNYRVRSRREFQDALISEVQIPTLSGDSKEPAMMTVKIAPEKMEYKLVAADELLNFREDMGVVNKRWHAANFTFEMDDFQKTPLFNRVVKIDQFAIKQQILEHHVGNPIDRVTPKVPGRLEFPNISVYVPEVDAAAAIAHVRKRLTNYVKPENGGGSSKAVIKLRTPDKVTLCSIELHGVDIVTAEPQKLDASAESMALVKLQIQCEYMSFKYGDE